MLGSPNATPKKRAANPALSPVRASILRQGKRQRTTSFLGLFAPLVFLADLGFLLGRKVVGNVKRGTNFLGLLYF